MSLICDLEKCSRTCNRSLKYEYALCFCIQLNHKKVNLGIYEICFVCTSM